MDRVTFRKAGRQDAPLLGFIRSIARYEKLENEVVASAESLGGLRVMVDNSVSMNVQSIYL
jgi:hypothetical protein